MQGLEVKGPRKGTQKAKAEKNPNIVVIDRIRIKDGWMDEQTGGSSTYSPYPASWLSRTVYPRPLDIFSGLINIENYVHGPLNHKPFNLIFETSNLRH